MIESRLPGRWAGGVALIPGPCLMLAGVLARLPYRFFLPDQLAALHRSPGPDPDRLQPGCDICGSPNAAYW
jgi:hypothetical protein